jgi:hypothetical protein
MMICARNMLRLGLHHLHEMFGNHKQMSNRRLIRVRQVFSSSEHENQNHCQVRSLVPAAKIAFGEFHKGGLISNIVVSIIFVFLSIVASHYFSSPKGIFYCVAIAATIVLWAILVPIGSRLSNAPAASFIPGTRFTFPEIRERFPLGYVIFSGTDGEFRFKAHPTDRLVWECDWSLTTIKPDFRKGEVAWTIRDLGAFYIREGQKIPVVTAKNVHLNYRVPLVGFHASQTPVSSPNSPDMILGTLSNDQLNPVFIVGFAILPDDHGSGPSRTK